MNGDIPDLRSLHLSVMDHDFWTLSESALGIIPHEPLRALTHERPSVADALWREALVGGDLPGVDRQYREAGRIGKTGPSGP